MDPKSQKCACSSDELVEQYLERTNGREREISNKQRYVSSLQELTTEGKYQIERREIEKSRERSKEGESEIENESH